MKKNNNLENQLEEKLQLGKSISLSKEEKERMSVFLSSYQEFNPVPEESGAVSGRRITFVSTFMRFGVPAFVLTAFFVGGGAVLAEKSLPGDSLYSLKTTYENVRSQFATSPESRARWSTSRVERRLSEARDLASDGRLSKEVAEGLAHNLSNYSSSIEGELENLRSRNKETVALEIDGEYRSTVRVYKKLLSQITSENDDLIALLRSISTNEDMVALAPEIEEAVQARVLSENDEEVAPQAFSMHGAGVDNNDSDDGAEVAMLSLGTDEPEPVLDTHNPRVGGPDSRDAADSAALDLRIMATEAGEVRGVDQLTKKEIFSLPIDTLESFVVTQLGKAESSLESSKLDKDLRKELDSRMKELWDSYESTKTSRDTGDESSVRDSYHRALRSAEDIRAALRVSRKVPQSDILRSLLENSEGRSPASDSGVEVLRKIESEVRSKSNQIETKVKNTLESATKKLGL